MLPDEAYGSFGRTANNLHRQGVGLPQAMQLR